MATNRRRWGTDDGVVGQMNRLINRLFERAQQSTAQLSRAPAAEALMTTANARSLATSPPVQPIGIAEQNSDCDLSEHPPARAGRLTRPSCA